MNAHQICIRVSLTTIVSISTGLSIANVLLVTQEVPIVVLMSMNVKQGSTHASRLICVIIPKVVMHAILKMNVHLEPTPVHR